MELQWAQSHSSVDSSNTFDTEEIGLTSHGSPKATKLFSRKPAVDLCRRFRQGRSRLDCSGEFAGFFSPTHNTPVVMETSQHPQVRLFLLQSPKAQKQEPTRKIMQVTPSSGMTKVSREPLKEIPTSKFELMEDSKCTPRQSVRYQASRKELKENLPSPQDPARMYGQMATYQKEMAFLKAENKTLKENNNSLQLENSRLTSQTRELQRKCKELHDSLVETAKKSTEIQRQKDIGKAQLNALKEELTNSDRTIRHLREACGKFQRDLEQTNYALVEARRMGTEAMAELEFVHNEASNERKLHQQNLKYAELKLLVLRKHRHDASELERSQMEVRRLNELNRKLKANVIELKERLNDLECLSREDLFSLSPQTTPRDSN